MRTRLSPGRLYALLSHEYQRARPAACKSCRSPFPYLVQPADECCANWYVTGFSECAHGCHRVMAKLIVDLWASYELVDLVGEARAIPDDAMRRGKDPVWNMIERERELKRT